MAIRHADPHERFLPRPPISARSTAALAGAVLVCLVAVDPVPAASIRTCYDRGYEDLKAKGIRCETAKRVYKRSLVAAAQSQGASVTSFTSSRLRWSCRARNPPAVAFYTWRCTARGGRMMQYRWKSGD
jgi:hypothetical protein